jgi:DNA-binding NarL/FixJ family response regulator
VQSFRVVPAIRVFHCDDSDAFTELVRHWLEEPADIEWVGAEHDPRRVGDAVAAAAPDVVLLDTMDQPGNAGLLALVRAAAPGVRVIVYSGYVSLMGPDGLGGDADAYLDKAGDDEALVACIRAVAGA